MSETKVIYQVASEVEKDKETQAKRVARLANELAMEINGLPNEVKNFLSEHGIDRPMAGLFPLVDMLKAFEATRHCERCNKPIDTKGRGSQQRFCSKTCRMMDYKRRRKEKEGLAAVDGDISAIETAIEPMGEGELLPFEPIDQGKETPAMFSQPMIDQIEAIPTVAIEPMGEAAGEPMVTLCEYCHKEFTAKSPKQRFCSTNCRVKAHKAGKAASEAAGKVVNRVVGRSGEFYERVELIRGAVELGIE